MHEYNIKLTKIEDVKDADCVIVAVAHNEFKKLGLSRIRELYRDVSDKEKVLIDVKGLYAVKDLRETNMTWWRL